MGNPRLASPHVSGNTLSDNLSSDFLHDYPVTESGYFGKAGTSSRVREIHTKDAYATANDFYNRISQGAVSIETIPNGSIATLVDGTKITYRVVTSSEGSPAININIKKSDYTGKVKSQKIHFVDKRR